MSRDESCDISRLPLGLLSFSNIRRNKMIYVDKTADLAKIAHLRTPVFFSRPRRFGKSLLVNTLHSLFAQGLEDFHGLAIEKTWDDTTYHVVHLDFSVMASAPPQAFKRALADILLHAFPAAENVCQCDALGVRDPGILVHEIARKLPLQSVVLLIDEYDAPLTHHLDQRDELEEISQILNNFYAAIKQYTDTFRSIFITGVTRVSHVSIFSAFNNLVDLSLKKEFNTLFGFTHRDLMTFFDPYIERASIVLKMQKEDVYTRLEQYYDGFQFSLDATETVYNPWSILSFCTYPEDGFKNYWFQSGGSSSLIMQYLKRSDSFNLLNYQDRTFSLTENKISDRYDISNIPREVLLLQAGYFSLRKQSDGIALLTFPNAEVEDSMLQLYLTANNLEPHLDVYRKIQELIDYIDQKRLLAIVDVFNAILNDCVSSESTLFQDERSVRDIIYAALPQTLSLQKCKERVTVQGRSDLELVTRKTRLIIEFKRTTPTRDAQASLQAAIEQIRKQKYGISAFQLQSLYRIALTISTERKCILPEFCAEV